eukprot:1134611-Pelagomonas_calceolata.AAC.2
MPCTGQHTAREYGNSESFTRLKWRPLLWQSGLHARAECGIGGGEHHPKRGQPHVHATVVKALLSQEPLPEEIVIAAQPPLNIVLETCN